MKKIILTSTDILTEIQTIFPEYSFNPKLKGKLFIMETPCDKNIPFTWAFPMKDGDITDYAIFEHISGRIYNFVGEPQGREIVVGETFENALLFLEALENDGEIVVSVTTKPAIKNRTII